MRAKACRKAACRHRIDDLQYQIDNLNDELDAAGTAADANRRIIAEILNARQGLAALINLRLDSAPRIAARVRVWQPFAGQEPRPGLPGTAEWRDYMNELADAIEKPPMGFVGTP